MLRLPIRLRLTRLSAWELCQARQEASLLSPSDDVFGLCLNACVLARALRRGRRPAYENGTQVLQALSPEAVCAYAREYLRRFSDRRVSAAVVNPNFDEKRFEELKQA